jgi:hypothetical protein
MALNVDGRQIPAKPLQPDFENAGYIRRYMGFYASKGITVHATNHQSFRQLSQKHVVLDVIHVTTGNRIYFDFYTSDGVFTAGLTTLGFILSREIFTESRRSENQITTKSRRVRSNGRCRQL